MGLNVSLEGAIYFTKLSVTLGFCWPPSPNSTKWEIMKFEILWFLSFVSAIGLYGPLLYSIYHYQSDSVTLTKSACFLGAVSSFVVKTIICKVHRKRIQALIYEMETFVKTAKAHERTILQRYVDKCSLLHVTITIINYTTTLFVICGPIFLPEPFPTPAVYPFSVDTGPLMYIVYFHQSFVGFQCSVSGTMDCQAALLMWYAGARIEGLACEFEKINDIKGLSEFINKHQQLLDFAKEVKTTMAYMAMTTTTTSGISTIFSSLQLVGNQPFAVKMQFGPVAFISSACLFICAWPADNLIKVNKSELRNQKRLSEQCDFVGSAAYNSQWINMSPQMKKNILMIMQRAQRPVIASIGGFLPALSMRYYASFLSTAFSYFTTLRIIVNVNNH